MRTYIDGFNDCIKRLNEEEMILQKNKKNC